MSLFISTRIIRRQTRFVFGILMIIAVLPAVGGAAEPDTKTFRDTLQNSLESLWTGREFTPELKRRQQALSIMLVNGDINNPLLESMVEDAFTDLARHQKTTRYILKTFPEQINRLLSPRMNWKTVKEIMWRVLSSPIKKDDPVLIKVGTLAPPGTPWLSVPETIVFPEVERLSDKKILSKIYGGGAMGEDLEVLEKMEDGRLECCGCTALGVLEICPEASALLLPGLFDNYEEVDYICDKFRKNIDRGFEKNGYFLWALIDTGFFYTFSKNRVRNLGDIRHQNMISWFGAIETTLFKALGIVPIPMGVPDIVAALNTGQADMNLAPAAWMLGMQAYQYSNFYLTPPLVYSPAVVIVSNRTVGNIQQKTGMPETFVLNMMETIATEWNAVEPEWKRQIRVYEQRSFRAFEDKCGMKAIVLPDADQQLIRQAGTIVQQELGGTVLPKKLMNDMKKALSDYRAGR